MAKPPDSALRAYETSGLSAEQIGQIFGVTGASVQRWMREMREREGRGAQQLRERKRRTRADYEDIAEEALNEQLDAARDAPLWQGSAADLERRAKLWERIRAQAIEAAARASGAAAAQEDMPELLERVRAATASAAAQREPPYASGRTDRATLA